MAHVSVWHKKVSCRFNCKCTILITFVRSMFYLLLGIYALLFLYTCSIVSIACISFVVVYSFYCCVGPSCSIIVFLYVVPGGTNLKGKVALQWLLVEVLSETTCKSLVDWIIGLNRKSSFFHIWNWWVVLRISPLVELVDCTYFFSNCSPTKITFARGV